MSWKTAIAAAVFLIMVILITFYGVNLFHDDDDEQSVSSSPSSSPTPTSTPTETEVATEPTPSEPTSRTYRGSVRTVDKRPVEDDVVNQVTLVVDEEAVVVALHLGIEQVIDLDDLGSNPEASDVACLSVDLEGEVPIEEMPNGNLRASGIAEAELDYIEAPCEDDEPGDSVVQEADVDLVISHVGTAAGVIELDNGQLAFSAR